MNYKKIKAPSTTVTRNLQDYFEPTGNIYETVAIMGRRANQVTVDMKEDLMQKLREFGNKNDSLDEEYENHEQIEISRYYERLPKPSLIAEQEFLDGNTYYRMATDEKRRK